ncbi:MULTISPECIES: (2Fe-2S)-binding protein [unclassified Fusibacter]|uniref:(2Fe-2S)-binding protein n=1 Tax=unclassified Fusibacter TaxID=2624464 RepID=UPI0010124B4A|nr:MULTISPECIES: 2Fe-2S iron-sulfur cluster-binding protein [unclassified Fusibacter]MCK8060395.1 2Fe-2S iron-sulfur cluster-binding protein [Fusibacter sp. A2]NPE20316.1 2Fe-2S iron-sulfur cluster binding domain-containing protein [Fusibacter sp. A1]RXV63522.1 (2Fe-2S)-binding protein [Fusibacter sp. A1]
MEVTLIINGDRFSFSATPDEILLDTLRKLGYKSVKRGCDSTSCGVCQILVDGKLVPSCGFLTVRANHKLITTIEGVQEQVREIANYITAEGVEQCGFCSPGHMMSLIALFKEIEHPTMEQVKHYLAGNMCRCSGYEGQHRALANYLEVNNR